MSFRGPHRLTGESNFNKFIRDGFSPRDKIGPPPYFEVPRKRGVRGEKPSAKLVAVEGKLLAVVLLDFGVIRLRER